MKKYIMSYGCPDYALRRELFRAMAIESEFFDEVVVYSPEDIGEEFASKVRQTLTLTKGGGFWLWKPYFMKKMLERIEEGDVLVYCGVTCIVNILGKTRFDQYVDRVVSSETGILGFELPYKEEEYTKKEVFRHFDTSEEITKSNQLMSAVLILRKCPHTVMLIDKWYETAIADPTLFTDQLQILPQDSEFIVHRNDQSVFSVIRKIHGSEIIPSREYFYDFISECNTFPFWPTTFSRPQ